MTAAGRLREKGHRQTKMQLGLPGVTSPAREVERAGHPPGGRSRHGSDVRHQPALAGRSRRSISAAASRKPGSGSTGSKSDGADDYPGLARVAAALATPVAGGE